ncbi:MAG: endo-1,4-beta-xylanase [Treponema sp.]|jgi:endo-1,4-beta-xylanase|nr:endo-1,4-beta-xylanase [Treponema sp.]
MIKKIILIQFTLIMFCITACDDKTALKTIYKNDFLVGNIITPAYMDGDNFSLLKKHFNSVTCENDMKPERLAPANKGGEYRWTEADRMVNKSRENGMQVHGHVLVWHSQSRAWFTAGTPEEARENMINHINSVLNHFKGRVVSWDVVNEAMGDNITDPSDWRSCLRTNSGWYRTLGPDFIELAFRTAREADPNIILYYNDYGLNNRNKAAAVRNMVKEINDKYKAEGNTRNLIDGIGMQGHYGLWLNVNDVRSSLELFKGIGVEISITELDVESRQTNSSEWGVNRNSVMPEQQAQAQANLYAALFRLFREYRDQIVRVTFWGMDDKNSWKSVGNPCLFDGDMKPKPAFFAVSNPDGN